MGGTNVRSRFIENSKQSNRFLFSPWRTPIHRRCLATTRPSLATETNRELPERRFWSSFRKIYGEMIPSTRWLLCWCCLLRLDWNCKLALCIVSRAISHRYDLQRVPVYDTARMCIDGAHEKNLWRRQKPMQSRNFHFPDSLQSVFPLTIVSLFARR